MKIINKLIYKIIIFTIIVCIFFVPTISANAGTKGDEPEKGQIIFGSNTKYAWPIPGYTSISSPLEKEQLQPQVHQHIIKEQTYQHQKERHLLQPVMEK